MIVRVNGRDMEVRDGATVGDLIDMLGHPRDRVAVEIDGEICPRSMHGRTFLRAGQTVEIVSFVGGG